MHFKIATKTPIATNCISRFQDSKIQDFNVQTLQCHRRSFLPHHHCTTCVVAAGGAAGGGGGGISGCGTTTPLPCSSCWRPLASCRHQTNQANRTPFHMQKDKTKKFMHRCIDVKQLSSTWESCCWCQGGLGIFLFCGIFLVWGRMRAGGIGGSGTGNTSCKSDSTSLSTTLVLTWVDSSSIYTRYA